MFDIIIKNATIYDGTGADSYRGDIGISGETITDVVSHEVNSAGLSRAEAPIVIDAAGKIVTPGFVDVHSHSDFNIFANPEGESKLRQGITSEVVGNCGFSAFPLRGETLAEERESNAKVGVDVQWSSAGEYFNLVDELKPAFNIATFVGHGNIRGSVVGFADRPATDDEMRQMKREVEEAMEAGALGMSTGLIYTPGIFANEQEIIELQRAADPKHAMYASHVRGEGDTLLEAADEFMAVIDGAGCQGQFSHLKASGPRNWGKVKRVIEQIEAVNAKGGNVRFDKYPYVASSTGLASILPRWVHDGGRDAALERLNDPKLKDRIIKEAEAINEGKDGWDSVLICEAGTAEFEKYQGKNVGEVATELGFAKGEMFLEFLRRSKLTTSICNFTMSQDETDLAILHPLGMVCTDAACRAPYGPLSHDCPHPRAYGTFGKFFRDYVKERPLLKLQEAVRKVTSLPCETFGFAKRGEIKREYFADLLVIDWDRYHDKSRFADPHHYCEGIDAIIVNGTLTLQNEQQTGKRNGRILKRGRA